MSPLTTCYSSEAANPLFYRNRVSLTWRFLSVLGRLLLMQFNEFAYLTSLTMGSQLTTMPVFLYEYSYADPVGSLLTKP